MQARSVLEILATIGSTGAEVCIEGGWGIDALLGAQTRDHGDLDLIVDDGDADAVRAALEANGFRVIFEDLPGHVSYRDALGHEVDLNIIALDRYGDRWNLNRQIGRGGPDYPADSYTYGWIAGERIACLGPETQVSCHVGYEAEEVDLLDMAQLRDRFGVSIPDSLR